MTLRRFDLAAMPMLMLVGACGGSEQRPVTASNCGVIGGVCTSPITPEPTPLPPALLEVTTLTNYKAVGGTQNLKEDFTIEDGNLFYEELYTAEQSGANTAQVAISYDPRSAVFTLKTSHEAADIDVRFQDPAHRTDFAPNDTPQASVPDIAQFNYLQVGGENSEGIDAQTFFYKEPGTGTRHVTVAGFARNIGDRDLTDDFTFERTRGAYVFGNQTPAGGIPTRGTGTYSGSMIATMVKNQELEVDPSLRSRFEWISGLATVNVDFGANSLTTSLTGTVLPTPDAFDIGGYNTPSAGAAFSASGTASLDSSRQHYSGTISQAAVGTTNIIIAGSSLDGTFYGPEAVETGGAFRIIGKIPDERVDIIGAFAGARPPR